MAIEETAGTHLLETTWTGSFAAGDVRAGAVGDGAPAVRFADQVLQA